MASLLYFGTDNRPRDLIDQFFKSRREDAGEINSITQITDAKKLEEVLVGMSFDLFLFEASMMGGKPSDWISTFKKKYPNIKASLILVGEEKEPVKIMKYIEDGFTDFIVLPPDKPLIIEKINLYCTGKRSKDVRQVYSLQMSQAADLAKPGVVEELSEFDCKVRSTQKTPLQDLVILYSKAFSENGNANGSVLGRCYESVEHPQFKGQFLTSFYFVGATPEILTNIRNALRKTYVAGKTKN
jgi:hypothetical protein